MAHYAYLDGNNLVTQVIVGKDEGGGFGNRHYPLRGIGIQTRKESA